MEISEQEFQAAVLRGEEIRRNGYAVSAEYDDPYAMRGCDPFVKTNKHGHGTTPAPEPQGSSPAVKAKLAQIAAAAVAANNAEQDEE